MMANLTRSAAFLALLLAGTQTSYGQYPYSSGGFGPRAAAYQGEEPPPLPGDLAPAPAQPLNMPPEGVPDGAYQGGPPPAEGGGMPCGECGDPSCGGFCCPPARRLHFFGAAEYMSVWTYGNKPPVLVSTSPNDTPRFLGGNHNLPNAGTLGRAGTAVYGGEAGDLNTQQKNGARVTFGVFLDPECNVGWVNRFWAVDGGDQNFFQQTVNGQPTITRPYFDPFSIIPAGENALIVGFRDENGVVIADGDIAINSSSEYLAAESYLKTMMHEDGQLRVDLISGYQFTKISTEITIDSFSRFFPQGPVDTRLHDHFKAQNDFHGGVFGFQIEKRRGRFTLNTLLKAGFGATRQQVRINGNGDITFGGNTAALAGSFLVQPSNAGANLDTTYTRWVGSVVPELNVTLGMWVTPHMQVTVGYTGIYWTDVMQAGGAIDRRINLSQQGGNPQPPALPVFNWNDGAYWLQGLNAGINWDF